MKWTSVPMTGLLAATLGIGIGSAQQPPPPPMTTPPPPPDPNAPPPNAAPGFAAPAAQTPYSRRGNIKAFNAGPNGETNGFILGDGTAILFPAEMGEQFRSTVKEGSRITVSGVSRAGMSGRMVVNAQTITANGQTFTVPAAPPLPPGGPGALAGSGPPPSPNGPPAPAGRGGRAPRPGPPPPDGAPPAPPPPGPPPLPPDAL